MAAFVILNYHLEDKCVSCIMLRIFRIIACMLAVDVGYLC